MRSTWRCLSSHKRLVVACLVMSAYGCSTFEISDVYMSKETGKEYVSFSNKEAQLSIMFAPDSRFGSVGVLGIPAIPIPVGDGPQDAVVLEVDLRLLRETVFSFALRPCLTTQESLLCPQLVKISPLFDSADKEARDERGNRTYGRIRLFSAPDMEVALSAKDEGKRITSDSIFAHYGYKGIPRWVFGVVRLHYEYACNGPCPTEFVLSTAGLGVAEQLIRSEGSFHFKKRRTKVYEALAPVQ